MCHYFPLFPRISRRDASVSQNAPVVDTAPRRVRHVPKELGGRGATTGHGTAAGAGNPQEAGAQTREGLSGAGGPGLEGSHAWSDRPLGLQMDRERAGQLPGRSARRSEGAAGPGSPRTLLRPS